MSTRQETSPENGKKGGRPVSPATLQTQIAREYIAQQVQDSFSAIVAKAIVQAMEGDKYAREWLSDRAWGKALQSIDHTTLGEILPTPLLHVLNNNSNTEDSGSQAEDSGNTGGDIS